ncbi:unnamed protein product [Rotaria magnacalcarata]|uniref:GDP-fucose protein O-fucosyltransferase 2 n=1 Tax=Rotaria magnacalcarata TaxID=392030 RepID=A0A816AF84_9BILA|nr:unnamed protein product [Rotaria magnacalcarata]CAF2128039.1 unnamed protein product [Rotaria magnacalcarata]CAF2256571.1 unnamed protein product [Rotaria magnacalcarata]
MSLPGSQHAVGTDGSDYQHRECIAPHYRASIESKSRLRLLIYSHFLLGFLVFVHILTYHTSLMSTLNVPRPHLWQYIWLNSILSSICGLVSINKNRIFLMKIFFRGTVIFGLGTIITTIIINLSELFTFKKLKTNHQLDELEPQTFFGFPLLSAYSLIADNNNNNNNNNQQCTKDSCSSITSSTYYVLYDVNHGEGFNLRRDVYIRMANLIHTLRERKSADSNWILVLPPWGPLYHWFSHNLPRTQLKWSNFFDIKSLSRFIPVIEFEDFLQLFTSSSSSSSSTSQITIPYVYTLQHFSEGWGENFEEKLEIRKCNEEPMYEKRNDNYYYGWFFGYDDRIRARQFQCLSAQGFVTVLVDFLIQNITWSDDRNKEQVVKSIMFDRAETVLHVDYGGYNYWRARRSMRYAKQLVDLGNRFRVDYLNSTDLIDRTVLIDDWTKMKRHHSQAMGGPYIGIHLRRRDYIKARPGYVPSLEHAARQVCHHLNRLNLSLTFIATDADENEIDTLRQHAHQLCETSSNQIYTYRPNEKILENILDGGKAIVDQWICAHARYFIGSYESTFSFRIQEDREILGFEQDSTFNRLCGDHEGISCQKSSVWSIAY